ncbi:hypothetical protein EV702DRAFT_1253459 [Suillus placidus]|uniref:Uncharacterized protein n=1 Tax=Suillus placidus TaxID=48579 RepID=A0A9P7CX45_9AGAM|nr:hypothetical protein EV702DRAFT_1253459 [Suillus placidus]
MASTSFWVAWEEDVKCPTITPHQKSRHPQLSFLRYSLDIVLGGLCGGGAKVDDKREQGEGRQRGNVGLEEGDRQVDERRGETEKLRAGRSFQEGASPRARTHALPIAIHDAPRHTTHAPASPQPSPPLVHNSSDATSLASISTPSLPISSLSSATRPTTAIQNTTSSPNPTLPTTSTMRKRPVHANKGWCSTCSWQSNA